MGFVIYCTKQTTRKEGGIARSFVRRRLAVIGVGKMTINAHIGWTDESTLCVVVTK